MSGNLEKYQSANPLKQLCLNAFQNKLKTALSQKIPGGGMPSELRMLDAGCGEGMLLARFAQWYPQADLTGLDFSAESLAYAKEHVPCQASLHLGDVTDMPFEDESFHCVLLTEVLEHLAEPQKGLAECLRVLKPGGLLVATVPNEPWFCLGNLLSFKNVSRLGNPIDHVNHWTMRGFARFVQSNVSGCAIAMDQTFPWTIALITKPTA